MLRNSLLTATALVFILSTSSVSVIAATYTVTNTNDSGPGSLRATVAVANSTPDNDMIVFDIAECPNGVCTIHLTSGSLTVNAKTSAGILTVSNPSDPRQMIISGDGWPSGHIFFVDTGAKLNLDGLTLENGWDEVGGGILNKGELSITNLVIRYCSVGDALGGGFGGGIANIGGNVTIRESEIYHNDSFYDGAGIYSQDGSMTILDSTIADNLAATNQGFGGGIALVAWSDASWSALVANSTVSGNSASAGGAIYLANSKVPVHVTNLTVTQNFGGRAAQCLSTASMVAACISVTA